MTRRSQTQEELIGHLGEQIRYLERSTASYDAGFEDEAKRLAVVIRVLVHDTKLSKSLLAQLGKKNIRFYDSSLSFDPRNILPHSGLTMMRMSSKEGASYVAPLDGGASDVSRTDGSLPSRSTTRRVAFGVWWDGTFVIRDKERKTFSRKALVLSVANTDGGAHVDPSLDASYADLSRFNSMGWKIL